jgi:hypothetical protein
MARTTTTCGKKNKGGCCSSISEAAEALGISELALKLFGLAGCPGVDDLALRVDNAVGLAREFAVSKSTISEWQKDKNFPKADADGTFDVGAVRRWRIARPNPPDTMIVGSKAIAQVGRPSGDLVRCISRWLRCELPCAMIKAVGEIVHQSAPDATAEEKTAASNAMLSIIGQHTAVFRLTEADVELLLRDCAHLI